MGFSLSHLVLVLVIVLLVFGAKKVPDIMKDLAKGYKAFTDGIKEEKKDNKKPYSIENKSDE
jgi:sec-independent protein translocase protein TatA